MKQCEKPVLAVHSDDPVGVWLAGQTKPPLTL